MVELAHDVSGLTVDATRFVYGEYGQTLTQDGLGIATLSLADIFAT